MQFYCLVFLHLVYFAYNSEVNINWIQYSFFSLSQFQPIIACIKLILEVKQEPSNILKIKPAKVMHLRTVYYMIRSDTRNYQTKAHYKTRLPVHNGIIIHNTAEYLFRTPSYST